MRRSSQGALPGCLFLSWAMVLERPRAKQEIYDIGTKYPDTWRDHVGSLDEINLLVHRGAAVPR